LHQALNEKMKQNEAQPSGKPENGKVARKENPSKMQPTPEPSLPQMSGPPSSLSAAKQQKLDALLQQYRADQLTPEQYHEQRAKVLSEP
jgi:hypothetical protein